MNLQDKTAQLLDYIQQAGAKHADAVAVNSTGESIQVRHGKVESIEAEHAQGIGLRGFVETNKGLASASASSSDLSVVCDSTCCRWLMASWMGSSLGYIVYSFIFYLGAGGSVAPQVFSLPQKPSLVKLDSFCVGPFTNLNHLHR